MLVFIWVVRPITSGVRPCHAPRLRSQRLPRTATPAGRCTDDGQGTPCSERAPPCCVPGHPSGSTSPPRASVHTLSGWRSTRCLHKYLFAKWTMFMGGATRVSQVPYAVSSSGDTLECWVGAACSERTGSSAYLRHHILGQERGHLSRMMITLRGMRTVDWREGERGIGRRGS